MSTRKRLSKPERREIIERAAMALFAERGYHAASMDEIAAASGVSVPVVYDHFGSKVELHRALLARGFAEMRAVWRAHLPGPMAVAIDAWYAYVEANPFASAMLFRDTTGIPEIEAIHREVANGSRIQLLPLMPFEDPIEAVMRWEIMKSAMQGLALWWREYPEVPRERLVEVTMASLWWDE